MLEDGDSDNESATIDHLSDNEFDEGIEDCNRVFMP